MSLRQVWYSFVAAVVLAFIVVGSGWFYHHQDIQIVAIHGVCDSIPFLVTIVFAVWAREVSNLSKRMRILILIGGLGCSALLAWRDYLDLRASRADIQTAIGTAVSGANQHSDQQVETVKSDVEGVKQDLKNAESDLTSQLAKTGSDIDANIGKVGTAPVKYAQLQFKLFDLSSETPKTEQSVSPDANGVYTVDFTATNISDTATGFLDIWVYICKECSFAEEPVGFDKPQGVPDFERHMNVVELNPGVTLAKMTIKIKISGGPFSATDVGFNYSCASCGNISATNQRMIRIYLLQPQPTLPLN
jgi:hypothetical protein